MSELLLGATGAQSYCPLHKAMETTIHNGTPQAMRKLCCFWVLTSMLLTRGRPQTGGEIHRDRDRQTQRQTCRYLRQEAEGTRTVPQTYRWTSPEWLNERGLNIDSVLMGVFLNLSGPQLPHPLYGGKNSSCLIRVIWGLMSSCICNISTVKNTHLESFSIFWTSDLPWSFLFCMSL